MLAAKALMIASVLPAVDGAAGLLVSNLSPSVEGGACAPAVACGVG